MSNVRFALLKQHFPPIGGGDWRGYIQFDTIDQIE